MERPRHGSVFLVQLLESAIRSHTRATDPGECLVKFGAPALWIQHGRRGFNNASWEDRATHRGNLYGDWSHPFQGLSSHRVPIYIYFFFLSKTV